MKSCQYQCICEILSNPIIFSQNSAWKHEFLTLVKSHNLLQICANLWVTFPTKAWQYKCLLVGRICNNFAKNRAFYDKSMKLGTWLVDNKTKKIRVSATTKMPSNGRHLVFPKWPPFSTYSV